MNGKCGRQWPLDGQFKEFTFYRRLSQAVAILQVAQGLPYMGAELCQHFSVGIHHDGWFTEFMPNTWSNPSKGKGGSPGHLWMNLPSFCPVQALCPVQGPFKALSKSQIEGKIQSCLTVWLKALVVLGVEYLVKRFAVWRAISISRFSICIELPWARALLCLHSNCLVQGPYPYSAALYKGLQHVSHEGMQEQKKRRWKFQP